MDKLTEQEAESFADLITQFENDPEPQGSETDIMHRFYGLSQAIYQLGAGLVKRVLVAEFPWYKEMVAGGTPFSATDDKTAMVDSIAEWNHAALRLLGWWLHFKGLGTVHLTTHMPCHDEYMQLNVAPASPPRGWRLPR